MPAIDAADAGSQPTPSCASAALAAKICSSVTDSQYPWVRRIARNAFANLLDCRYE